MKCLGVSQLITCGKYSYYRQRLLIYEITFDISEPVLISSNVYPPIIASAVNALRNAEYLFIGLGNKDDEAGNAK